MPEKFIERISWGSGRITLKFIAIGFSLLSHTYLVAVGAALLILGAQAFAQSLPIPPPFPSGAEQEIRIAEGDKSPPRIDILTEELSDGKNVFKVRISDDSSLRVREVRYIQDGQFKTEGLFKDQNDEYNALIDIHPPSRIVVVTAGDHAGNTATAYQEYEIADRPDIFKDIVDILSDIPGFVQRLLGGY